MKVSFHGAARTVTGSKHLLEINADKKILLDCGMFQGMGRQTLQLNSDWGFAPSTITCVILSHAHIDHIGLLPKLVKDGFQGFVYCTPATADLVEILLVDSAHIQESDVRHVNQRRVRQHRDPVEPLYTEEDVKSVLPMLKTVEYEEPFRIGDDVEFFFTDCGHLLGSAAVNLIVKDEEGDTRITYSGDVGRYRDVILCPPQEFPQADYIIMESTYGNSLHGMAASTAETILKHIKHTCVEKGGKLIIPAFALGRTQELLYYLNRLSLEHRLPDIKYYVDSPLSINATTVIKQHPDVFNDDVQNLLKKDDDVFAFEGLRYVVNPEDSQTLSERDEACVIISASGMAEAGRVKHHIAAGIGNPNNTVLIVGYCDPRSLGGRLKAGDKEVEIYGDSLQVKAEVEEIDSMSAHGDYDDLFQWLSCQDAEKVKQIFLVHGEFETQQAFKERLARKGFDNVIIPEQHQSFDLQ